MYIFYTNYVFYIYLLYFTNYIFYINYIFYMMIIFYIYISNTIPTLFSISIFGPLTNITDKLVGILKKPWNRCVVNFYFLYH